MEQNEKQKKINEQPESSPFHSEDVIAEINSAAALFRKNCGEEECFSTAQKKTVNAKNQDDAALLRGEETVALPDAESNATFTPQDMDEIPVIPLPVKEKPKKGNKRGLFYALLPIVAILVLVSSMTLVAMIRDRHQEEELPASTGIYYYVSGVVEYASLFEDNSIKSRELVRLENGDPVEFLYDENYKFVYVLDHGSGLYGYMLADQLVDDIDAVDYEQKANQFGEEKSLGYYYVTKTKNGLTLWENPDGGGVVKAKLKNGYKVSVLEETNDSYWYVFDYHSAERGYVRISYLTDDKNKVVGVHQEPKDKTIVGDYYVQGVNSYLSLRSEPSSGASLRGKLYNGDKVGLIQKTNGSFWYVYSYSLDQYGYAAASYLTTEDPKAKKEEEVKEEEPAEKEEPKDTEKPVSDPTVYEPYTVTGTDEYLPVRLEGNLSSAEVGRIHNGDSVNVIDSSGGAYWYVYVPSLGQYGYVLGKYLTK
ncbi:MAG TPA: SH3 domain-containing protein [Clostridiales bacterium]|nr:SH3 domain-containing protein [Clostridiales bacterium]